MVLQGLGGNPMLNEGSVDIRRNQRQRKGEDLTPQRRLLPMLPAVDAVWNGRSLPTCGAIRHILNPIDANKSLDFV